MHLHHKNTLHQNCSFSPSKVHPQNTLLGGLIRMIPTKKVRKWHGKFGHKSIPEKKKKSGQMRHKKNLITFHYTDWLIVILINALL